MLPLNEHIALVNNKLQQLLKRYEMLHAENNQLQQTVAALQQQQTQLNEKLGALQQQHLILKASASPLNAADKKELEQKINTYLKNIDKCIALLAQ